MVNTSLWTWEPSTRVARTCRECVPLVRPRRLLPPLEPGSGPKSIRMPLGSRKDNSKKSTAVSTAGVQNTSTTEQNEWAVSVMESATTSVSSSLSSSSSGSTSSGSSVTGSSSSMVVTSRTTSATGANSAAEAASTTARVIVEVTSPSSSVSSMPPTVTSWATLQLSEVKVRTVGETTASDGSDAVTLITTVAVGSVESTTEMESLEPNSDTSVVPSVAVAVNPAASSSVLVTLTVSVRAS